MSSEKRIQEGEVDTDPVIQNSNPPLADMVQRKDAFHSPIRSIISSPQDGGSRRVETGIASAHACTTPF